MSLLTNDDIRQNAKTLVDAYLKGIKVKEEDKPVIEAGVALITNLLENINDIAYFMSNEDARRDREHGR